MTRDSSGSDKKTLVDEMKELADRLEEAVGQSVETSAVKGELISASIEEVRARVDEARIRVFKSLLESSRSINRGLLERACNADPEMAAARNPPPIRSRSKSFDAACCALEQIRCNRLRGDGAVEWLKAKADGLIDQKIAKSVLSLAKPGYQRNRGKHGKDSARRKDLDLKALDGHPAWGKYRELIKQGFCSDAFAALLLAAEYELENVEVRNTWMPNGLDQFLRCLGFYENEVKGYSSLIRDKGAKAARNDWGYGYRPEQ